MKKISIQLTDEQYEALKAEMRRCQKINQQEETFSGMEFILGTSDDGIFSSLDFKMHKTVEIGEVDWKFE